MGDSEIAEERDQASFNACGQFVFSGSTRYYERLMWDNVKYTSLLFLHVEVFVSFLSRALKLDCLF